MVPFTYARASGVDDAIHGVADDAHARFLAGGTNLIDYMKEGVERPTKLVDIRSLPLGKIEDAQGGLRIGALVTNTDLAYHPLVRERYPVLSEALLSGASPQLRNAATVGGNILQRTRCFYFRDTAFACNKREPGSGCAALAGFNRIHAVLGGSDSCIATHPSDMCVALAALDAVVHTRGPRGERSIRLVDFHVLPGGTPELESVLMAGELITSVELPASSFAKRSHYLKVRDRASYEFALASAAIALEIRDGTIVTGRIALGGVGTKPWRATTAEQLLAGQSPTERTFQAAAEAAFEGARGREFNLFKIELGKRTVMAALAHVARMEVV